MIDELTKKFLQTIVDTKLFIDEDECTNAGGSWRTIKGTHVCIKKGETVESAFKRTTGEELGLAKHKEGKTQKASNTSSTISKVETKQMKATELIEKHNLVLNNERIQATGNLTAAEKYEITNNKTAIMAELKQRETEYYAKIETPTTETKLQYTSNPDGTKTAKVSAKSTNKYAGLSPEHKKLANQLPEIEIKTDGNDKLADKLIDQAKGVKMFNPRDPENEGLNLGQNATKRELYAEAQKHCSHPNLKNELYAGYTADARHMVKQTCTCAKCTLWKQQTKEATVKSW